MKRSTITIDGPDLVFVSPVCSSCKHLTGFRACAAFKQIPREIWTGENTHLKPFPGDGGIQYEKRGEEPDPDSGGIRTGTKHQGPGDHPSGSPQSVHGTPLVGPRGGTGRRAIRRAKDRLARQQRLEAERQEALARAQEQLNSPATRTLMEVVNDVVSGEEARRQRDSAILDALLVPPEPDPEPGPTDEEQRYKADVERYFGAYNGTQTDQFLHDHFPGYAHPRMIYEAFNFTDPDSGLYTRTSSIGLRGGIVAVNGNVYDAQKELVGTFSREFTSDGTVHHSYFQMGDAGQGKGFGSAFYERSEKAYELLGAKRVTIHAGLDVGGYAWARMGFDYADGRPSMNHQQRLSSRWQARYGRTIPVPSFSHPWELAVMRGPDGYTIGKEAMLGSSWYAEKLLVPSFPGYQVGKLYYALKHQEREAARAKKKGGFLPSRAAAVKHLGPGPHPSGSPQSVHGKPGGEAAWQREHGVRDVQRDKRLYKPEADALSLATTVGKFGLKQLSDQKGIPEEALLEMYQDKLLEVAKHPVSIRRSAKTSLQILEGDGVFKTQFQTGRSSGEFDPEIRLEAESFGLGAPAELEADLRPKYGFVKGFEDKSMIGQYGLVEFVLKDTVKARSTMTPGDSFANFYDGSIVGSPLGSPGIESAGGRLEEVLFGDTIEYYEVQIQGKLTLSDVDRIIVDNFDGESDDLIAAYKRAGYKVTTREEEGENPDDYFYAGE